MRVTFANLQTLLDGFGREVARFEPGSSHDLPEPMARHFLRHGVAMVLKVLVPEAPAEEAPEPTVAEVEEAGATPVRGGHPKAAAAARARKRT